MASKKFDACGNIKPVAAHVRGVGMGLVIALSLAGCGDSGGGKASTQVAATVNSGEITVHQINTMLSQARNLKPENAREASTAVLERLIDQELLVRKAEDAQLDRDPRVVQVIEAARREVLAKAYIEQVAAAAARPSEQEIKDYFAANPALFAQRRIYNLQELSIRLEPERHDELRQRVDSAASLQEVVEWLRAQNIPFGVNTGIKAAEQLPMEMLPRFEKMKDGQLALIRQASGITVVNLVGSRPQPISAEQARPLIEQYLLNQRKTELAQAEVKRLRQNATIAYQGEFSAPPAAQGSASSAAASTAGAPAAVPQASASATGALEKGVAGLK